MRTSNACNHYYYHLPSQDTIMKNTWDYRGNEAGQRSCTTCHNDHGIARTNFTVISTHTEVTITVGTGNGSDAILSSYPINCSTQMCYDIYGLPRDHGTRRAENGCKRLFSLAVSSELVLTRSQSGRFTFFIVTRMCQRRIMPASMSAFGLLISPAEELLANREAGTHSFLIL